jgi:hypothetical protein
MRAEDGRSVELSCFAAEELDEALAGPPIAALSLSFADEPLGAALIARLAAAPALRGLRSLSLQSCSLGHDGARALADAPLLAGLESLRIGDDLEGAAAVLLGSPGLAGLRALALEIPWDEDSVRALGASLHLGELETLDLGWYTPSGPLLTPLIRAASLPPRLRAPFRRAALDELRAAARRPSSERWIEAIAPLLAALLDPSITTCPEDHDVEAMSLAELRAQLGRWPSGQRAARCEWLADALRGEPSPALAWADRFAVYRLRGARLVAEDMRHAEELLARGAPRRLDLRYLQLGPYALVRWLRAGFMREVEALDLCGHALAPEVLAALERSPGDLRRLHLWGCVRKPDALRRLLRSPLLARLQGLELAGNELGDRGAKLLAATPALAGLESLELRNDQIGDEGCAALAHGRHWQQLRELDLSENPIGDRGAAAFEQAELPALERLELGYRGHIGDEGACALARARLPSLRRLGLDFLRIGDRGALALVRAVDSLPALRELDVCHGNDFTPAGAEALAAAAPLRPELRLNLGFGCGAALRECAALQASTLARDAER